MNHVYNKSEIPLDLQQYFVRAEIGLESTPEQYIEKLVSVFREVRRVLRNDGTCWVNIGDSYYNYRGENNRRSDIRRRYENEDRKKRTD